MMASCLVLSASALTMMVRTVWPFIDGTSDPRAMMRILPSFSSLRPKGGADQPMSIWPDITAVKVGGAGNYRLDGFTGAGGADVFQHQTVLLVDARVLPERRRLVFPVIDLADHHLELIFGRGRGRDQRQRDCQRKYGGEGFVRLHSESSHVDFVVSTLIVQHSTPIPVSRERQNSRSFTSVGRRPKAQVPGLPERNRRPSVTPFRSPKRRPARPRHPLSQRASTSIPMSA